ncbi:MAG: hypothetical protein AAGB46_09010, partial [Verrucomicrobiota bacterium]
MDFSPTSGAKVYFKQRSLPRRNPKNEGGSKHQLIFSDAFAKAIPDVVSNPIDPLKPKGKRYNGHAGPGKESTSIILGHPTLHSYL